MPRVLVRASAVGSCAFVILSLFGCGREQGRATKSPGDASGGSQSDGGASNASGGNESSNGGSAQTPPVAIDEPATLTGVRLVSGDTIELSLVEGRVSLGTGAGPGTEVDGSGLLAFPAFVDSHVHLAYFPVGEALAETGVLAAVDLAAPIETLETPPDYLELIAAGPMVTSLMGYPTQSWGRNGYGLETGDVQSAREAVARLVAAGAGVIKVPVDGDSSITDAQLGAIVEEAHTANLKVAAHALSVEGARRAAEQGCDVLAHTPTEELPNDVVAAWSDRAVISTLKAFGASDAAVANLTALYDAGATVLYGTDLGNLRTVGLDTGELRLLEEAGLPRTEALAAATTTAAEYWGIATGTAPTEDQLSFVLLDGDPTEDLDVLLEPTYVFFEGRVVKRPED